jgi:CheY-like chemotaxis protein
MNDQEISRSPLGILLVDDGPGDVRLTVEAFRLVNRDICLHVAADGLAAMAYLTKAAPYEAAFRPDLILLDLNLPKMDGREVLLRIKASPALKTIPVIVLSTSESEVDIANSYLLQANCFVTKPVEYDVFESLIQSISDFWLTRVKLPQFAAMA